MSSTRIGFVVIFSWMSASKDLDVVVLGGLNMDYLVCGDSLPHPGESVQGKGFQVAPGGKGANQSIAVARLGGRAAMIGCVGADPSGDQLLQALRKEGVGVTDVVQQSTSHTGVALIMVDGEGEKQIMAAPGANFKVSSSQIRKAGGLIARSKVLLMQFEVPMPMLLRAAQDARAHGTTVLLDPAPAAKPPKELLSFVDVFRANTIETEAITGIRPRDRKTARAAAEKLFSMGVGIAIVPGGEKGNLLISPDEEHWLPRIKVRTVDATGAGDAFAAAVAVGLAEGMPLAVLGQFASAAAALATTKLGAQTALPTRSAVRRLMKRR